MTEQRPLPEDVTAIGEQAVKDVRDSLDAAFEAVCELGTDDASKALYQQYAIMVLSNLAGFAMVQVLAKVVQQRGLSFQTVLPEVVTNILTHVQGQIDHAMSQATDEVEGVTVQ